MDAIRTGSHSALNLLETAVSSARSGFASMFSTVDEYERALIRQRRAQGRYDQSMLPVLTFIGWATVIAVRALWFDCRRFPPADQDADRQHDDAAQHDLKHRLQERRVHVARPDPGDRP